MVEKFYRSCCLTILTGCALTLMGGPESIGYVRSAGDFRVNGSVVRGNSTVLAGNVVETEAARSVMQLGGAQITLSPQSQAKVFGDHTVLMKGEGLIRDGGKYAMEANQLRIVSTSNDAVIQVDIQSPKHLSVAARSGVAQVRNTSGMLLAEVRPGLALAFDEQTGGNTAVEITGTVTEKDGKYFLTDSTTNLTYELRGPDVAKYKGKKVKVVGAMIPGAVLTGGATAAVAVSSISAVAVGAATGAATGAILTGKGLAIIAGVAIGGTVAGLAAAGSFSGPASTSGQ